MPDRLPPEDEIARLRAENERLQHLCRLGSIVVSQIRDPDFPAWFLDEADDGERQNTMTGLQILGDAFVELARRQDMLPRFAIPGRTGATPAPCGRPPKGEDPQGLSAEQARAVTDEVGQAPNTLHTHPNPKREDR